VIIGCVLVTILLAAAMARAETRSIHVEWGYTPPTEPEVTGFQLYQEGTAVCTFPGAETTAGDCTVDLTATVTNFTLTAMFDDNTESPHSAPFAFNPEIDVGIFFKFLTLHPGNRNVPMIKPGGVRLR
jgi:hypothetical protein